MICHGEYWRKIATLNGVLQNWLEKPTRHHNQAIPTFSLLTTCCWKCSRRRLARNLSFQQYFVSCRWIWCLVQQWLQKWWYAGQHASMSLQPPNELCHSSRCHWERHPQICCISTQHHYLHWMWGISCWVGHNVLDICHFQVSLYLTI